MSFCSKAAAESDFCRRGTSTSSISSHSGCAAEEASEVTVGEMWGDVSTRWVTQHALN